MEQNNGQGTRSLFGNIPFAGIIILVVVIAGLVVDATNVDSDNFYEDIIRQDDVATKIHQNYVEEISSKDLIDNAIKGMLRILDPHTSYFAAKQYEELKIHTEGKFGGLGIQISIRDKVLTVMTPIGGTPAARAGIQSGDQIIRIEGKSTAGISIDNAVKKLRGEPGTKITITIRRKGEAKDLDYTITREIIHIKSVPFAGVLEKKIGYVQLQTFSQEAGEEVEKAVRELVKKDVTGLIFDLRHNPGGLLPEAIEVAEKFLPRKSLIVSTRGRVRGQNRENYSGAQPVYPIDLPLVVLVDYASASASEIVAGAIQDYDRGIIVGDTTFGKGSVQSILPLDKTHHLKLTTAFYYTPSGRCINRPENAVRGTGTGDDEEAADEDEEMDFKKLEKENVDTVGRKKDESKIDTATYLTKNGRIVRGGGGIIPDTIVEQKNLSLPLRALFGRDLFFQFANMEYPKLKKRKVRIDKQFKADESIMKSFYRFIDSIKFDYQSLAQMRFSEFKLSAGLKDTVDSAGKPVVLYPELPKWSDNEKQQMELCVTKADSLLRSESKRALAENETDIRKYIREALLTREFGQDNEVVYRERLSDDPQLQTALTLLSDNELYTALLQPAASAAAADITPVKKIDKKQ
ncbi:MAG: S41 family peptidase [Chitinispirillaceae bacterium]|nr:S41 family peptidase [Chitinispirillaceae bacterium]